MTDVQFWLSLDQVLNLTENHLQFSGRQSIVGVGREQSVSSYLRVVSGPLNPPPSSNISLLLTPPWKDTNRDWAWWKKIQITQDQGSTVFLFAIQIRDLSPPSAARERWKIDISDKSYRFNLDRNTVSILDRNQRLLQTATHDPSDYTLHKCLKRGS